MPEFFEKKMSMTTPLSCPACGTMVADVHYIYQDDQKNSFFYVCSECTFIFARPVLIPELNNRKMDGIDNAEMFNSSLLKTLYITLFIKREIRKLAKLQHKKMASFLDIGCGTGWTTFQFKQAGYVTTGLEPSEIRADFARKQYGLEIVSEYVEHVSFDRQFDTIMLRHIIEHFADPETMVRKVGEFLKDDGYLFVIVPNINCLGRYLFGTKWSWVLPIHCNFFTPKSIRAFLEKSGYQVVECYQTPSPIYYPKSVVKVLKSELLKSFFNRHKSLSMLLFAPLAIFGSLLGLGDNLNVIARKKIDL